MINKTNLKILTLNVCGLSRRVQYPEFLDLINNYDILCLVETKTDDVDEISIPNFEINMKNRFLFKRVKSGGIILAFKTYLVDKIKVVNTDSKYILWFTITGEIFRLNQDIVFTTRKFIILYRGSF